MDQRTMHRLGVYATTAITAITAQNLDGVRAVQATEPEVLGAQIDAVFEGFELSAIKTGMLWSASLIDVVADRLADASAPVVVDPVMVATSGARLLELDAVEAYRRLLAHATVVTPNLDEAEVFLGEPVNTVRLEDEARVLMDRLGCAVLLKGGHLGTDPHDVLATPDGCWTWSHARLREVNTHGTGCMLSSALAARLALGRTLLQATQDSLAFVHDALARAQSTVHRQPNVEAAQIEPSHLRRL